MSLRYGSQSTVSALRSVLVKRPDSEFGTADPETWHYADRPDLKIAQAEHDGLVATMRKAGVEVFYHDEGQPGRADAIYVRDPALIVERGAVILRMGKVLRRGEEGALARRLKSVGVPVYYTLHGDALAEGGDLLWIDHHTLAVGVGFRTNVEGVCQLEEALNPLGVSVFPVQLPYYTGPEACLHLM